MNKAKIIRIATIAVAVFLAYIFYNSFFKDENTDSQHKVSKQVSLTRKSVAKQDKKLEPDHSVIDKLPKSENLKNQPVAKLLNIKVYQLFPSQKAKSGYAFIAYNGKPQQVYITGMEFEKGVVLKSVSSNHVIIDNQGELQSYPLIKSQGGKTVAAQKQSNFSTLPFLPGAGEPPFSINSTPPPAPVFPSKKQAEEYIPPPPSDSTNGPQFGD